MGGGGGGVASGGTRDWGRVHVPPPPETQITLLSYSCFCFASK